MTDRHMNYDLDGVFASRNQGQLISSTVQQRKSVRTPGLVPMRATRMGYAPKIPFAGYEEALAYQGTAGWLDDSTNIPRSVPSRTRCCSAASPPLASSHSSCSARSKSWLANVAYRCPKQG